MAPSDLWRTGITTAHGWLDDQPMRAVLTLRGEQLKVVLTDIETSQTTSFAGKLNPPSDDDPSDTHYGTMERTDGVKGAPLEIQIWGASIFGKDPGRLRIEGTFKGAHDASLRLYHVNKERLDAIAPYERALKAPADIEAAVVKPDGHWVFAHFDLESRALELVELGGMPPAPLHTLRTDLACDHQYCLVSLQAYPVRQDAVLISVSVTQTFCGPPQCREIHSGQVTALTSKGFGSGSELFGVSSYVPTDQYDAENVATATYWADVDGVPPLEILTVQRSTLTRSPTNEAKHKTGETGETSAAKPPELALLAFDKAQRTYTPVESCVPKLSEDEIQRLPSLNW